MCAQCHTTEELWQGEQAHLYVSADHLAADVHWNHGVVCHDCHGGNPASRQFLKLHRPENGFRATRAEISESCGTCHRSQMIDATRKSVHAKAGEKDEHGDSTPIACSACHGEVQHQLLPSDDPRSPVFRANQVQTCGACHQEMLATHMSSVHAPRAEYTGSSSASFVRRLPRHAWNLSGRGPTVDAPCPQRRHHLWWLSQGRRGRAGAKRARPRHGREPVRQSRPEVAKSPPETDVHLLPSTP